MRRMTIPFVKMHGCGNDFVIVDQRSRSDDDQRSRSDYDQRSRLEVGLCPGPVVTPAMAAAAANRHTGIGCDQFIVLESCDTADVFMRIYNPDGSEAGACGNATRCVADILMRDGRNAVVIQTISGNLPSRRCADGRIQVDMGSPKLDWSDIPLSRPMNTLRLDLPGDPAAASMGNPHATFFVADLDATAVTEIGPLMEHDPLFPARANIGFAQIIDPATIRLKVWERGAGLTLACGSGACATLVNAVRRGLTGNRARIIVDGGDLEIEWRDDRHVLMTGPVAVSFTGQIAL